jgi:hypothetical protein
MIDVYSLGVLLFEMIAGQPPFVLDNAPPEGPSGPPLTFAQCNPSLVVPGSVTELVAALLNPRAAEHGLNAARAVQMLEALLGRPSLLAAEPVTSQMASAQSPSQPPPAWNQPGPMGTVPPPDIRAFTTSSSPPLVWPSSPAPAPGSSFPPLPQGFSPSMFPPPAVSAPSSSSFPPPAVAAAPAGATPFPPPAVTAPPGAPYPPPVSTAPSVGSFPPPAVAAPPGATPYPPPTIAAPSTPAGGAGAYPPTPPSQRNPARVDEPFATPSFPPPAGPMPSSPDLDMELRPSFIGRLKRLFTRKRPGEL